MSFAGISECLCTHATNTAEASCSDNQSPRSATPAARRANITSTRLNNREKLRAEGRKSPAPSRQDASTTAHELEARHETSPPSCGADQNMQLQPFRLHFLSQLSFSILCEPCRRIRVAEDDPLVLQECKTMLPTP